MSITLAPRDTTMEDIDTELDRFNDAMRDLGYEATVRPSIWGETIIEVTPEDSIDPIAEFWSSTPDFLDDFREYANNTIDATSVPRAALQKVRGL